MRSAANASQRSAERLASLTFFLDHQIGRHIVADKLREAGATVEAHLDHFKGDAPDLEWIPEIGRRDWVSYLSSSLPCTSPQSTSIILPSGSHGLAMSLSPSWGKRSQKTGS